VGGEPLPWGGLPAVKIFLIKLMPPQANLSELGWRSKLHGLLVALLPIPLLLKAAFTLEVLLPFILGIGS